MNGTFIHSRFPLQFCIALKIDLLIKAINRNSELQEKVLLKLDKLCTIMSSPKSNIDPSQELLDNVQTIAALKISPSTLYRLKRDEEIIPERIGKRDYYTMAEIRRAKKK